MAKRSDARFHTHLARKALTDGDMNEALTHILIAIENLARVGPQNFAVTSAPDPRPAGCVCPVERVVKVLAGCAMHGGDHA